MGEKIWRIKMKDRTAFTRILMNDVSKKLLKEGYDDNHLLPTDMSDDYTYLGERSSEEFHDIVGILEEAGVLIDRSYSERGILVKKGTDLKEYLTDEMISKLRKEVDENKLNEFYEYSVEKNGGVYMENTSSGHNKFYAIEKEGDKIKVTYGRIGAFNTGTVKMYDNITMDELINAKLKHGYKIVLDGRK
jgi:predicted DNA-binding WGR domain protein